MFGRVFIFGISVDLFVTSVFGDAPIRGVLSNVVIGGVFWYLGSVPSVIGEWPLFLFGAFLFAVCGFVWGGGDRAETATTKTKSIPIMAAPAETMAR